MPRKRITRKIGSTDGNCFELTAQGIKDRDKLSLRRQKEREHRLILKSDERRKKRAETVAINALNYILNTKKETV